MRSFPLLSIPQLQIQKIEVTVSVFYLFALHTQGLLPWILPPSFFINYIIIIQSESIKTFLYLAWFEGAAILLAVAVVSLVGAGSDYKKEIQFVKNAQISEKDNTVSTPSYLLKFGPDSYRCSLRVFDVTGLI